MFIQEKNSADLSIDHEETTTDFNCLEEFTAKSISIVKNKLVSQATLHQKLLREAYVDNLFERYKITSDYQTKIKEYLSDFGITIISSSNEESDANNDTDDDFLMDADDLSGEELDDLLSDETPAQDTKQQSEEEVEEEIIDTSNNDENSKEVKDSLRWYLCMVNQYKPLRSREEEQELFIRMHQGDEEAREEIFNRNLKLVVDISKKYWWFGPSPLDVIQEGNLGLLKAMNMFDYQLGYKFSTYATWWIRQAITRAIADQARTIRIPVHMVETINKLIRVSRQLLQELGREPTPEEIAEEMKMPVERVREILKISQEPVSLETPIGEEEDSHLGDFIKDDNVPVPADAATFTLLKEQLEEVLGTLTEREQKVLTLRFGLEDGRARTLEEVGKEFNVTRERIRQIEAKALRKLRHPSRSRKLKDYLE